MKTKHYSNLPNDDERMAKRPDDIPLEDFKTLLKFWADEHVQVIYCIYSCFKFTILVALNN